MQWNYEQQEVDPKSDLASRESSVRACQLAILPAHHHSLLGVVVEAIFLFVMRLLVSPKMKKLVKVIITLKFFLSVRRIREIPFEVVYSN